jgi:hypothetical protein
MSLLSLGERNSMFNKNHTKETREKISASFKSITRVNLTPNVISSNRILKYKGISVKIFDRSNNLVYKFPSMASAAKHLNHSRKTRSNIVKTGISYDDYIYKLEITRIHSIIVVNKENENTKEYYSIRDTARSLGVSP